jgi:hypothetical protein
MTKEEILEKMVNKHTQDVDSTTLATLLHSMIERIEKLEKNAKDDHRTLGKLYQQSCTHEDGVGSICNYCGKDLVKKDWEIGSLTFNDVKHIMELCDVNNVKINSKDISVSFVPKDVTGKAWRELREKMHQITEK